MRIAVLADIHGNLHALEAVLEDIVPRKPDLIVDLGDCVSGPLWPRETMDHLTTLNLPTVRGNHDRHLATLSPEEMGESDRFAYDQLTPDQRTRLGTLPFHLEVAPGILAFHGTPSDDELCLTDALEDGRFVRDRPEAIAARLGKVDAKLVLCGHSHRPDVVQLHDGPTILNPGSVGCPAFEDPPYVSESGSPHARYAVVDEQHDGRFAFELILVPYPYMEAAHRADANGRPEWAHALRTGFMLSHD